MGMKGMNIGQAMTRSITVIVLIALAVPAAAQSVDAATLAELQRMIARQQEQMKAQAAVLERLQRQVEMLSQATRKAATTADRAVAAADKAGAAKAGSGVVKSGQERVSLAISGQVDRGVLFIDDGTNSEIFHVDNDHSSTRVRFVGTGRVSDDFSIGSQIEVQMESNSTGSVSQDGDNDHGIGGTSFTERKLEVYLDSLRFGRVWLGQGQTASDGTSQVDLSGTTLVAYSNSPDEMSGGIKFLNKSTDAFGPAIKDVFSNFDGLSRDDRVRYDSPKFGSLQLSASHISGGAVDVALRHAAEYGPYKTAAAIAFADPSSISSSVDSRLNGSISVRHESGVNGTFATGREEVERAGSDPVFVYGKLGYVAKIFDIGDTAFAIDFTRAENVQADGDEATSYGLAAVQNLAEYGTQFYLSVRNHELDRTGSNFDDVLSTLAGVRVKF